MCNLYRLDERDTKLFTDWESLNLPPIMLEYQNPLWPKGKGLIARNDGNTPVWDVMQWGVPMTLPGKRPGTTVTKHVTNVRNLRSPFWRSMLKDPARRCLVPFTRFAEPKPDKDPETGRPAQYWFNLPAQRVAAFAGIWRPSKAGNVYAFLTCEPNPLVKPLHERAMPVILHPEDFRRWLTTDFDDACSLAVPFPSQLMEVE